MRIPLAGRHEVYLLLPEVFELAEALEAPPQRQALQQIRAHCD